MIAPKRNSSIRFLRAWHGHGVGAIDDRLGAGVQDVLVRRGIAERVQDEPGELGEPIELDEPKNETKPPKRKRQQP